MPIVTGLGPFRNIPDAELRLIFYLSPQKGTLLEVIPITTSPPPGTNDPRVTGLLRRMLYLRRIDPPTLRKLADDARALRSDRQMIAISAKLLNLMKDAFEKPWAFPALLTTKEILSARAAADEVADWSRFPGNATASTPAAVALSYLSRFAGASVAHAAYMATLTNRNYEGRVQRLNAELNLRGMNAELVR